VSVGVEVRRERRVEESFRVWKRVGVERVTIEIVEGEIICRVD